MEFLVKPNFIQHLDLSRTDCVLEHVSTIIVMSALWFLSHIASSYTVAHVN